MLIPIAKKQSIQDGSLYLLEDFFLNIYVKNGCANHSDFMGEDPNNDLSYGQRDHSVGILQYVVAAMEEE